MRQQAGRVLQRRADGPELLLADFAVPRGRSAPVESVPAGTSHIVPLTKA